MGHVTCDTQEVMSIVSKFQLLSYNILEVKQKNLSVYAFLTNLLPFSEEKTFTNYFLFGIC